MNLQDLAVFAEAVRSGVWQPLRGGWGSTPWRRPGDWPRSRQSWASGWYSGQRVRSPTAEGEAFLPHAQAMLDEQASALAALRPAGAGVSGQLRVTASAAFGRKVVAPMIARFMAANPDLGVDLLLTDDQVDIVAQGIDVAVRIAKLRDNHLVARRLADNPRRLCAAPAYIARHGKPRVLADLVDHACLLGTGGSHWVFVRNGKTVRQKVGGRFTASSIEALHQACIGGLGIANLSGWNVEDDLRAGVIEPIRLEDAEPEPLTIWAVYPTARLVPAKVRAFVGALEQELRGGEHRRA
jgi:DNA-binding transcriptional LysR family regulator